MVIKSNAVINTYAKENVMRVENARGFDGSGLIVFHEMTPDEFPDSSDLMSATALVWNVYSRIGITIRVGAASKRYPTPCT